MSADLCPSPIFDNLDYLSDPFSLTAEQINPQWPRVQQQDYFYSLRYLQSYKGSSATFNSYRRELERLLQWLWHIQVSDLTQVRREHIELYMEFCLAPQLPG